MQFGGFGSDDGDQGIRPGERGVTDGADDRAVPVAEQIIWGAVDQGSQRRRNERFPRRGNGLHSGHLHRGFRVRSDAQHRDRLSAIVVNVAGDSGLTIGQTRLGVVVRDRTGLSIRVGPGRTFAALGQRGIASPQQQGQQHPNRYTSGDARQPETVAAILCEQQPRQGENAHTVAPDSRPSRTTTSRSA